MRFSLVSSVLALVAAATATIELPAGVPRSVEEFRDKHPYVSKFHGGHRRVVRIRSSRHDKDDISAEFLRGIKKANNGGTLYLPKDELFIIGEPLDLTFLNNIHVRLDGEIKVRYQKLSISVVSELKHIVYRRRSSLASRNVQTPVPVKPLVLYGPSILYSTADD